MLVACSRIRALPVEIQMVLVLIIWFSQTTKIRKISASEACLNNNTVALSKQIQKWMGRGKSNNRCSRDAARPTPNLLRLAPAAPWAESRASTATCNLVMVSLDPPSTGSKESEANSASTRRRSIKSTSCNSQILSRSTSKWARTRLL